MYVCLDVQICALPDVPNRKLSWIEILKYHLMLSLSNGSDFIAL